MSSLDGEHERGEPADAEQRPRERNDLFLRIRAWLAKTRGRVLSSSRQRYAIAWIKLYWANYYFTRWRIKYAALAISSVLVLLVAASIYSISYVDDVLEKFFSEEDNLSNLRTLLVTVGSALTAVAAISSSLIMFAMQVNVERLPHGMFFRFSRDRRIMAAFAATFLFSIGMACASLIPSAHYAAHAIVAALWCTIFIFALVVYAYRRALFLISPIKQITAIIDDASRELRRGRRRAERARVLFSTADSANERSDAKSPYDLSLAAYFQQSPNWTLEARYGVNHAMSFARRYAEIGDYTVSSAALSAIIAINSYYVKEKGRTFVSNNFLMPSSLSTDGFINHTLEHLRQNISVALARKDEQQILQTLEALTKLTVLYLEIDYSSPHATRTHAHLAAAYLSQAVQEAVQQDLTDVVMQGLRWMGQAALLFLEKREPNEIATLVDKIGSIGCAGVVKENTRAVTMTAVEQLSKLTLALLGGPFRDISFANGQIKKNVVLIAKIVIHIPDRPLASVHSSTMAAYYGGTSQETLLANLAIIANSIIDLAEPNDKSKHALERLEDWAEEFPHQEKELLLLAIEKRSHFTFDIIRWIASVAEILLALAVSPSGQSIQEKFRKHALWLVYTFSWIPRDKETVAFVENYRMTETLFEAAIEAQRRESLKNAEEIADLLLKWAFEAGRHQIGWAILERSLYGVATLALLSGFDKSGERLKSKIRQWLTQPNAPEQELMDRTARDIRERAATLYRHRHWSSIIEQHMAELKESTLRKLLEEIADIISPGTKDEEAQTRIF